MATIDPATAAALDFPLTRVAARYQQLYDVAAIDVARRERELKRYLVLRSKHPSHSLPITKPLDELWHLFLLDTREYSAFCETLGRGFIHHVPGDPSHSDAANVEGYRELLKLYEQVFSESPPADVWPAIGAASARFGNCDSAMGHPSVG
jgi:hypothetical protein